MDNLKQVRDEVGDDASKALETLERVSEWISKELPIPTNKATVMLLRISAAISVLKNKLLNATALDIKPLEWVTDEDRICLAAYALGMTYRIIQLMPGTEIWLSINGDRTEYETEDEAKVAAQIDFDGRVKSVLTSRKVS